MWTEIEIIINSDNFPEIKILKDIKSAFNIFYDYQNEFSRFDKNSSLSQINKNKSWKVSEIFLEVLELSKEIYKKTNWYFNPLVNIWNIWYSHNFKDYTFIKTNFEENLNLYEIKIVWNNIYLKPNQNFDFWWIVKWLTVDKVWEFLENKNYNDYIINAGWDIFSKSKNCLAIDSPENNWDIFALVDIENMALCTSWTYKRKWKINWENFHHILNPKKNINNDEIKSISLIAEKTYIWDAYATACIAMWIEKSLVFLKKEKIIWIIIWNDDKIYKMWDLKKYKFEII